jgi:hypothetical protein
MNEITAWRDYYLVVKFLENGEVDNLRGYFGDLGCGKPHQVDEIVRSFSTRLNNLEFVHVCAMEFIMKFGGTQIGNQVIMNTPTHNRKFQIRLPFGSPSRLVGMLALDNGKVCLWSDMSWQNSKTLSICAGDLLILNGNFWLTSPVHLALFF